MIERNKMKVMDDNIEILFNRLQVALANLDAAFPAGEYKLNKRQNLALNEILDVSFEMSQESKTYRKELKAAKEKANKEREAELKWMIDNGLLTAN